MRGHGEGCALLAELEKNCLGITILRALLELCPHDGPGSL